MRIAATSCLLFYFLLCPINLAQSSIEKLTTSINGTIINSDVNPSAMVSSENNKYWCTYEVNVATDEMRKLSSLKLFENENPILNLNKVPGSDVSITNSGKLVFYDHSEHFKGILKLHVYSKEGNFLFEKTFSNADQFEVSPSGDRMGLRNADGISILSLADGSSYLIEKGLQFSFAEDDVIIAVAQSDKILVYKNSLLFQSIQTGIELPRKVIISATNNLIGVIDKYTLKVFSINNQNLFFKDDTSGEKSYRDLKIVDGKIVAGIHKRNKEE